LSSDLFSAHQISFQVIFPTVGFLTTHLLASDFSTSYSDVFTPSYLSLGSLSKLRFASRFELPVSDPFRSAFLVFFLLLLLALGFPSPELLFGFTVRRESAYGPFLSSRE
jgi:hypothetical protein